MPRDETEYSRMLAEFQAKHGKVTIKRTSGPKARKAPKPTAEDIFAQAWESEHHPVPMVREFAFYPGRKFRLDFAFPSHRLGIELQGRGRHQTVVGGLADSEKACLAVLLGWRILWWPSMDKKHVSTWVAITKMALSGEFDADNCPYARPRGHR